MNFLATALANYISRCLDKDYRISIPQIHEIEYKIPVDTQNDTETGQVSQDRYEPQPQDSKTIPDGVE